jgi:hypothetical protein
MNIVNNYSGDLIYKHLHQSYMNQIIKEIHTINTLEYQAKKCAHSFLNLFITNKKDRRILNKLEVSNLIINKIIECQERILPSTKFMKIILNIPIERLELCNNPILTNQISLYIECYDGKLQLSSVYYKNFKSVEMEINGFDY